MNGWANKYLSNISFLFFSFFFSSIKRFFLHYFPRCKFTGGNSFEEIVIVSRKLIPIPFPSPLKSFGFNVFVDILIGEITLRPVTLSYNFNDNFNWRKSRRINFHASRNISRVGSLPPNPIQQRTGLSKRWSYFKAALISPIQSPPPALRERTSSCASLDRENQQLVLRVTHFVLIDRKERIDRYSVRPIYSQWERQWENGIRKEKKFLNRDVGRRLFK